MQPELLYVEAFLESIHSLLQERDSIRLAIGSIYGGCVFDKRLTDASEYLPKVAALVRHVIDKRARADAHNSVSASSCFRLSASRCDASAACSNSKNEMGRCSSRRGCCESSY